MEIITVQQANQTKTVPELRTMNSAIWIRLLEDDRKRLKQTVSFFIPKALEESCAVSGPTRFLTKTYSDNVINKVLL